MSCLYDDEYVVWMIIGFCVSVFLIFIGGVYRGNFDHEKQDVKAGVAEFYQVSPDDTKMEFRYKTIQPLQTITNTVYVLTNNLTIRPK